MSGREMTGERPLLHEALGEGEPVVLVGGGLSGWLSWIPHAERLSASRKAIRVQLRSVELAHAGRPFPAGYGTPLERDALGATVDALALDRFDLVGWSYGAHVALAFALDHPHRVRTLTLIEPPAVWVLRETGHAAEGLAEDEAFDRSMGGRRITDEDLKGFLVRAGFGRSDDDFEALPSWPIWHRNRQVISLNHTIWAHTDSLQRVGRFNSPLLAVKGTRTTEPLAAIVEDLASAAPRGTLLELPGGHACHIESIDRFLEALDRHLASS